MGAVAPAFASGPGSEDDPAAQRAAGRARLSVAGGRDDDREGKAHFRVLLVEDDPSMRLVCRFNLETAGVEVATAATGEEALSKVGGSAFDLVLLDVMLPDFSGFEVAERLRLDPETARVPVVFVSARGAEADLARGRAAGAIDYIVKPFDPTELARRLRDDVEELERSGAAGVWHLRFGSGRAGM